MKRNKAVFYTFLLTVFFPGLSSANKMLDLLEQSAIPSKLASQSVLMATTAARDSVIVVGERGHILSKQKITKPILVIDKENAWLQHTVPVSVTLTAVTVLSDGTKIAVGHDSVILRSVSGSNVWEKVFTGYDLLKQKKHFFERQIVQLQKIISVTQGDVEELEYQLEDLNFALEDIIAEQLTGPNKPLLSLTSTSNDILYATGAYGTLLTSGDKGKTWQLIEERLNNPEKYHLNSIISAAERLYIVGENGLGFTSEDQGQTWSEMPMPYSGSLFGIVAGTNIDSKATQLVAFGLQGNIMVSLDRGENWTHHNIGLSASLLGGDIAKNNQVYLVGHGGIVIDFHIENIKQTTIRKHPSGSAFSAVTINNDSLILAGQFGIIDWNL